MPELVRFTQEHFPNNMEIILIPNPCTAGSKTLNAALRLSSRFSFVRVCQTATEAGKGFALKAGVKSARGRWIFMTDADLPYHLSFFLEAARCLRKGFDFVTANRRLPTSQFRMSTRLLAGAYNRYLLGWSLNHLVRFFLPVGSTDTQAGAKAMKRAFAEKAFARVTCPGFLYDLELFLAAHAMGSRHMELPVQLKLESRTSTVQVLRQIPPTLAWGFRILMADLRGFYRREAF